MQLSTPPTKIAGILSLDAGTVGDETNVDFQANASLTFFRHLTE
jgi:hypothetical protein